MLNWGAYSRLARFDKPVGILLLWYPTAWALWLANKGVPSFKLLGLFFLGTVLMRSAGCVVNDMADRNVDKYVKRTRLRPLTSGEVTLWEAVGLLVCLLSLSLVVLICLPVDCFFYAVFSLFIVILYPFCKRWINAPQIVLGLAFSMGIPMAYAASGTAFNADMILIFLINFAWIIAYDTMYAMTDKDDDLKIGVKSTAIYFADYDRLIIGILLGCLHSLWLYWALSNHVNYLFYPLWCCATFVLIYQQRLINKRVPEQCFRAFLISNYYGFIMWLAVIGAVF